MICNAGLMHTGPVRRTKDGHETHWQCNYLGHFLLVISLCDVICRTPGARVVVVASRLHSARSSELTDYKYEKNPRVGTWTRYARSKLALVSYLCVGRPPSFGLAPRSSSHTS